MVSQRRRKLTQSQTMDGSLSLSEPETVTVTEMNSELGKRRGRVPVNQSLPNSALGVSAYYRGYVIIVGNRTSRALRIERTQATRSLATVNTTTTIRSGMDLETWGIAVPGPAPVALKLTVDSRPR